MEKNSPTKLKSPVQERIHGIKGMIHSIETLGADDGPGLRVIIFLEGCHLRCAYCCNKDMLDLEDYMYLTPHEVIEKVKPYKSFIQRNGGITISGGDPAYQPEFVLEILKLAKGEGLHTAIDTSMFMTPDNLERLIPYTDLFMVSLKHFDNQIHRELTQVSNQPILKNLRHLSEYKAKHKEKVPDLWFRYVILPGYTDTKQNLEALISFLHEINFELIELLPYHTLGAFKWKKLGLTYPMDKVKPPTQLNINDIKSKLESHGFEVRSYE